MPMPRGRGDQPRQTLSHTRRRRLGATAAALARRQWGWFVPILCWLFDVRAIQADVLTTLSYYLPYFAGHLASTGWLAQGRVIPLLSDVTQLLIATQVLKAITLGTLKPRGKNSR
jgi:cellulose synthase (UDP-forming)